MKSLVTKMPWHISQKAFAVSGKANEIVANMS